MAKTEKIVDKKDAVEELGSKTDTKTVSDEKKNPETPKIVAPAAEDESGYQPIPGYYHLIKVDDNGNDILGSDFSISPRTYERTYKRLPQFRVKKSPK